VQGVGAIRSSLERRRRGLQRLRRAAQLPHRQRDLGFRDDTAGTRQLLMRAEATGRSLQQLAGARIVAELCHGDSAEGERWCVVA
jgi:hypothetical protein